MTAQRERPGGDKTWPLHFDWGQMPVDDADQRQMMTAQFVQHLAGRPPLPPSEELHRFGRYLAAIRHIRGWTQLELARKARLHPAAIGLLEVGALTMAEISTELLDRLADAFGMQHGELTIHPTEVTAWVPARVIGKNITQQPADLDRAKANQQQSGVRVNVPHPAFLPRSHEPVFRLAGSGRRRASGHAPTQRSTLRGGAMGFTVDGAVFVPHYDPQGRVYIVAPPGALHIVIGERDYALEAVEIEGSSYSRIVGLTQSDLDSFLRRHNADPINFPVTFGD
jgi:transcriptional regulator with XRE-family HTH domain